MGTYYHKYKKVTDEVYEGIWSDEKEKLENLKPHKDEMIIDWCEEKNLPCIMLDEGDKIYDVCYEQSKPTFEKKLGYKISKATWEKFRDGQYKVRR